jgi:membrane-associated phospholipid phosphatase
VTATMTTLRHLDDRLLLDVNTFARHTGWLHGAVAAYAMYGVVLFGVLLVAGVLLARRGSDRALAAAGWAPVAMLLAVAVNQPIGGWINEARPYATHPHLLVLATRTSDFSFPSDHAVMAGAVAAGLLLVSRRLGLAAVVAAVVMAFARVYIAAHYPWDVAAGLAEGAAVAVLGWLALSVPLTALTRWLRGQATIRSVFAEQAPPAAAAAGPASASASEATSDAPTTASAARGARR